MLCNIWCQIKANATGLPVYIMKDTEGAASYGAAMLAGVNIGLWTSFESVIHQSIKVEKIYYPEAQSKIIYDNMKVIAYKN